tara:strand:- start:22809 stop:23108 length:300 start_codon:yes stop_codon:yes gene_type:complete
MIFPRKCTYCCKGIDEGYVVCEGDAYYCSDECFKNDDPATWDGYQAEIAAGDYDPDNNHWCYHTDWEIDTEEQIYNEAGDPATYAEVIEWNQEQQQEDK